MKTVTLYEVTMREVALGDSFTVSRHSGTAGPRCAMGGGLSLLGVQQMPLGFVWCAGEGRYVALSPQLRAVLEEPILAAARHEIELQRAELLADMASWPWYLRVWRALWRAPSTRPPAGPCAVAPA